MPKKLNLPFILFSILILLACFLLFKNLSNMSLWSDEGSHAVFARSVLEFGYPRVYDGHVWQYPRFLNRPDVNISNPAAAWTYHTWLPYYATALSFFLFGQNTFAARLPSALLGLGSLILVGLLTRQWFENRKWASVLTVLLVLCSVPFLLHIRQARYFSYMIFFVLLSFVTYNTYVKHKNGLYLCLFLFSLFGLFFSNQGVFMPVFATLGLFALTFDKTSWNKKSLITVILVAILFTTPWFLQAKSSNHIILELNHAWKNVQLFIRSITKYIFPLVAWLLVFLYYGVRKQNFFFKLENEEKKNLLRIAIFVMMSTVLIALQSERSFRYFIQLVPFFLIIEGFLLSVWFSQKRVAPAIFFNPHFIYKFFNTPSECTFLFF
jgi:4-amino-4-deoxy-L-arabinose transferase-like glycosyltransferase